MTNQKYGLNNIVKILWIPAPSMRYFFQCNRYRNRISSSTLINIRPTVFSLKHLFCNAVVNIMFTQLFKDMVKLLFFCTGLKW